MRQKRFTEEQIIGVLTESLTDLQGRSGPGPALRRATNTRRSSALRMLYVRQAAALAMISKPTPRFMMAVIR